MGSINHIKVVQVSIRGGILILHHGSAINHIMQCQSYHALIINLKYITSINIV
jgi:hypothetical protein